MENGKPLVSVLIPSLNSKDYIKQCVESVMNQTLEDIEILCIDAESGDGTQDILNQLAENDSRIRIFSSDRKSYGYQMNIGLENSNGEYVAIVESDDYIDENMLKELYKLASEYDADIAKSTFYHFYDYPSNQELKVNDAKKKLKVTDSFTLDEQPIFLNGHPSIWAGIYKNELLKENSIRFMEEEGGGWVDNPFFYETAFLAKKIVYRHVPYYYYRETNPNSSSNSLGDFTIPIRRMMDNLDIVEKYGCRNELILKEVYVRAFAYIYNIFRRDGHEQHLDELRPLIQKMLLRLDESIVLKYLRQKHVDTYYRYISPIHILDDNAAHVNISQNDLKLIKKENEYLYSKIDDYKKEKQKLNKEIKSLKNEIDSIKNSKANKLGSILAKPIRKLK